jgi:acid stress-induced BolA-like protein IbaG/YrbA
MSPTEIKAMIEAGIPGAMVMVNSEDGVHFSAAVVSEAFRGLSMVKAHQLIYQALGNKMQSEIHALAIKTYTPEAWEQTHPRMG